LSSSVSKMQGLKGRLQTISEEQVHEVNKRNAISIGEFRTHVRVQIYCEECGRQYDIEELLERGGCRCDEESG
ncbi:MAG: rod-determining factor RdfA, partial [Halobacteriaceae archaeon]